MQQVLVLGGGASGLAAALAAARAGARVTVLERNAKPGKKLLATGNGRCNLDNTGIAPERYFTSDPAELKPLLAAVNAADPLGWFESLAIGMQGVYGGINLVITKGKAVTGIPADTQALGKQSIGPIPIPFIICLVVLALILFMVKKTKTGRYIYAIGNSREAAKILGIKVDRIRVMIYSIVGFISALAGLLYVCRLGSAQTAIGEDWPMNSIAASVIGGVALTGGVGNPAGALIGAAVITIIQNIIVLFGVNSYWQSAVSGIVVVLAISFSSISTIVRENRQKRIKLN